MPEKQPSFTVTDRRKFTLDGELRDPSSATLEVESPQPATTEALPEATPGAATDAGENRKIDPDLPEEGLDEATEEGAPEEFLPHNEAGSLDDFGAEGLEGSLEDEIGPGPTSRQSEEQNAAYQRISGQLDEMIRQANPGVPHSAAPDFEQLVQSFYLSAIVALGAAAEPGQKPRVDLIGARQSIDLLAVLADKTRGNLTPREEKLLQSVLFELRMLFLDVTNNLAAQAARGPRPGALR